MMTSPADTESLVRPIERQRVIRSYVRREGHMTHAQQRALQTLWPIFGVTPSPETVLDLPALFNTDAPVILDIGFGAGEALLAQAQANPDTHFLGVEVYRPGVGRLLAGLHEAGLTNVRVLCADIMLILKENLAANSLHGAQLFFPDPWRKKKHHKRRLVQPPFVEALAQTICPGGFLHLATDWQDYAEQMRSVMQQSSAFEPSTTTQTAQHIAARARTRFEQRGQRLGHTISDFVLTRKA